MRFMANRKQQHSNGDNLVMVPKKAAIKSPRLFKVVLLNDDYTPMDFVIVVLEKFFAMTVEQATIVMYQVHRQGKGVCGIYPRDIATTKVAAVTAFARQHQHPLACIMEES